MRVIGGNLKGKKILMPVDKNTRPLKDLVKESIFNLLAHSKKIKFEIQNSKVLDLFSGTGNVSFEFASRGVASFLYCLWCLSVVWGLWCVCGVGLSVWCQSVCGVCLWCQSRPPRRAREVYVFIP